MEKIFFRTPKQDGRHPFAHVAIDHSHSQRPVPRRFPLFKRCWVTGGQLQHGQTDTFQTKLVIFCSFLKYWIRIRFPSCSITSQFCCGVENSAYVLCQRSEFKSIQNSSDFYFTSRNNESLCHYFLRVSLPRQSSRYIHSSISNVYK